VAAAPDDGEGELEVVSCGIPGPGHEVRVVDALGRSLPERSEGEIVSEGPSVGDGYYGDPAATAEVFREGAIHTGDMGFLADGELYVTGRRKNLIIVRGRNYHPNDLELAATTVDGVRRGGAAAFASPGADGAEEVTLVLEAMSGADPQAIRTAPVARVHAEIPRAPRVPQT
jgi:fatty-acyl-CoA synthase